jgi:heat shock protein HslJ
MLASKRSKMMLFAIVVTFVTGLPVGCGGNGDDGRGSEASAGERAAPPVSLPAELLDNTWRLDAFGTVGEEDPVLPDAEATLAFDANGQVTGSTGCNSFSTTYATDGTATMLLHPMVTTGKTCSEAIMDQELQLEIALGAVESFEASEDELLLFYDEGDRVLVFTRAIDD